MTEFQDLKDQYKALNPNGTFPRPGMTADEVKAKIAEFKLDKNDPADKAPVGAKEGDDKKSEAADNEQDNARQDARDKAEQVEKEKKDKVEAERKANEVKEAEALEDEEKGKEVLPAGVARMLVNVKHSNTQYKKDNKYKLSNSLAKEFKDKGFIK